MGKAFFFVLIVAIVGCSSGNGANDPQVEEYIKIIDFWPTDSVTVYNRGYGLGNYLYYEPQRDSLTYRNLIYIKHDSIKYETFVTNLKGSHFDDSLNILIEALGKYANGYTYDTTYDGATYCGPCYYIEYKKGTKISYYSVAFGDNDTLNRFCKFYSKIDFTNLKRTYINNSSILAEKEAVYALKVLGEYDKLPEPYIPRVCSEGIDKLKIVGAWRQIVDRFNYPDSFTKLVFTNNDSCYFENIQNGALSKRFNSNRFSMDTIKNILIVSNKEFKKKISILKITDSCLILEERGTPVRYNKL